MRKFTVGQVILALIIILAAFVALLLLRSSFLEQARENYEHDNFCESYTKLKLIAPYSKEAQLLLAHIEGGAFCGPQNLKRAEALFRSVANGDMKLVGADLFRLALEVADLERRRGGTLNESVAKALFRRAKELGFVPQSRDLSELHNRGLIDIFKEK